MFDGGPPAKARATHLYVCNEGLASMGMSIQYALENVTDLTRCAGVRCYGAALCGRARKVHFFRAKKRHQVCKTVSGFHTSATKGRGGGGETACAT